MDESQTICDECVALCNCLAGVRAHEWRVSRATNTLRGIMRWTEYEMIAIGTEARVMLVATLPLTAVRSVLRDSPCHTLWCRMHDERPPYANVGCARYPEDYDMRG